MFEYTHLPMLKKTFKPLHKKMGQLKRIKIDRDVAKDNKVKAKVLKKTPVYYLNSQGNFEKVLRKNGKSLKIKDESKIVVYWETVKTRQDFCYLGDVQVDDRILSLFVQTKDVESSRPLKVIFDVNEKKSGNEQVAATLSTQTTEAEEKSEPHLIRGQVVNPVDLLKANVPKPGHMHRYSRKNLRKKKQARKSRRESRRKNR